MNAIDMCMTNMLTIQRFRTKNLWKRMSNNNNNKSHIMDELKHMSNSEKIEQKMEKTVNLSHKWYIFPFAQLFLAACCLVCALMFVVRWIESNISCFDRFVIRIAFLWIVYCIRWARGPTHYLYNVMLLSMLTSAYCRRDAKTFIYGC